VVWPALASGLLPGFDQWWEEQNRQALAFSGFAVAGLMLNVDAQRRLAERPAQNISLDSRDDDVRTALLGSQMYSAAGSMSAYMSFRSAVRTQKPFGRFQFLENEESVDELLSAPLDFSFLKRPTTYLPLAGVATLMAVYASSDGDPFRGSSFRFSDAAFASSFSYLAGTNEEALFRGWMMPVYMDAWDSPFWSNTTQALVFALAHLGPDNPLPLPQLALGWYLGYLTQKNHWTLRESIFIHAWWDLLAFTGSYLHDARSGTHTAVLRLPAVLITF
jgi:membrane protease YdiL (CAAX protease family)